MSFSMSFGMAFIQDLEASHVIDEFKEFQKVLTEALVREIGEVRGTLAHVWTVNPDKFFQRAHFMFLEDGKNCRENLWGWDYFLSHVRENLLHKD